MKSTGIKWVLLVVHPKGVRIAHKKISWNRRDHLEDLNVGERAIVKLHWSKYGVNGVD